MKNLIICILLVSALGLASCSDNPEFLYDSPDNIYFNFKDTASSSITFSFAYTPEKVADTIFVPVKISGIISNQDRYFKLAVVDTATTAEQDLHYEAFKDSYVMPADSGTISVPVIIYNKDPELEESTVSLAFTLIPTTDFEVTMIDVIDGKISFSNRLEQPGWWIYWMSSLGLYSRTKHQLFLISAGTNDMPDMSEPDAYLRVPEALYHIARYTAFISDPFSWVEEHPEYALTEKENGDYDFYLKAAPEKVILLKKDMASGSYHFIDEKGQSI